MSDILCVTNRKQCREDFLLRLEKIAASKPAAVILREKDLPEGAYRALAERVLAICESHGVPCILHTYINAAISLGVKAIHLPLPILRTMTWEEKAQFQTIGASCHSVEDALEAERLGCTYITAGHIFATGCKKGLPGRGSAFLREICEAVTIPVYAIGGITPENMPEIRKTGASGGCIMSGFMRCEDPEELLGILRKKQVKHEIFNGTTFLIRHHRS